MLIKPDVTVKQRRRFVNALFRQLVLYRNDIAVAVGLNARVRQAPFQNQVVVVNDFVRLQVRAQHLHRQGQRFHALYAANNIKALHFHFFHKVPGGIAVVIYPRWEQVVLLHGFHEPRRNVGIVDTVPVAQTQQAPVEPFVIGDFVLLNPLLQAVGGQPVHLRYIFAVIAALHEQQVCTGQVCRYGQVNAADTVRASERFKVKRAFVVYIVKGKLRRFNGFPDVKFLAQNAVNPV